MTFPTRMWINQPSTSQPLHHLHGTRVLVVPDPEPGNKHSICRIFFVSGEAISQRCDMRSLSPGWPE